MPAAPTSRTTGKPKKQPIRRSKEELRAARKDSKARYEKRQKEAGFVTVELLCPKDRIPELKAIAAAFRATAVDRKERVERIIGVAAPKTYKEADKVTIRAMYERGSAPQDMLLPGMSIDDLIRIICEDEDYNLVDVRRDLYKRYGQEPAWKR